MLIIIIIVIIIITIIIYVNNNTLWDYLNRGCLGKQRRSKEFLTKFHLQLTVSLASLINIPSLNK